MARINHAPRYGTLLVGFLLAVLGALGTYGPVFPDKVGAWLCVASTVVLLLGVLLPGL